MAKLVHANVLGNLILGVSHAYISQINMQADNARFTPVFDRYINFSVWFIMALNGTITSWITFKNIFQITLLHISGKKKIKPQQPVNYFLPQTYRGKRGQL